MLASFEHYMLDDEEFSPIRIFMSENRQLETWCCVLTLHGLVIIATYIKRSCVNVEKWKSKSDSVCGSTCSNMNF